MAPTTSPPTTQYDPVLSLLADAMELIAAAREEYAAVRWDDVVDARVAELLRQAVPNEATINHIRENGIGPVESVQVTR